MGISCVPALTLGLIGGAVSMLTMIGRQMMAASTVRT